MQNVVERIKLIVKENMIEHQEIDIKETDEFVADLGYDSVRFMGLFYCLEDEFNISIISSDKNYLFFSVVTVQDLIDIIKQLKIEDN